MARKTNAQLQEELASLRKALDEKDAELISWATYQRDWDNRWAIHADECNLLFNEDCPRYWSNIKRWAADSKEAWQSLAKPVLK